MPIEPKDLCTSTLEPSDITPASTANLTKAGFVSANPGRDVQRVGTARFLGQDPYMIHCPVWAVTGNLGDSHVTSASLARSTPSRRRSRPASFRMDCRSA